MKRYLITGLGTSLALVTTVGLGLMLWPAGSTAAPQAAGSGEKSGTDFVGLWYAVIPVPIPGAPPVTGFMTVHTDGTLSWVRNVDAGGPPPPPTPGAQTFSAGQGLWRRARAGQFESVAFLINYDFETGNAVGLTRVRSSITVDRGGDSASGEFFGAFWLCGTHPDLPCPPDPTKVAPDIPEEMIGLPFTMARVRLP